MPFQTFVADQTDEDGNLIHPNIPMSKFHQISLPHISSFLKYMKKDNNEVLTEETILKTTKSEWDQYCINPPLIATASSTTNDVKDFIKGNKHDKTQYKVLKYEQQLDNWERSFIALAGTHKIAKVFNPLYTPSNTNSQLQFSKKQEFAYTVLDATLHINIGKTGSTQFKRTEGLVRVYFLHEKVHHGTNRYWQPPYCVPDADRLSDQAQLYMLPNTVQDTPESSQGAFTPIMLSPKVVQG
jgi:hypothetical protein